LNKDSRTVQQIFFEIIEMPADERQNAIREKCPDDSQTQSEVARMVKEYQQHCSGIVSTSCEASADNSDPDSGRDGQVAPVIEDFVRRLHAGESPTIEECVRRHPGLESRIRQLLPALMLMEGFAKTTTGQEPGFEDQPLINGRYLLQQKIGQGGMGEVWVARQSAPVKRKVALKLIKKGMDSRSVIDRFGQERQALAMMDHPNIARVLDGGVTASGQPYFVMELVNGLPIDKYCDEAKLSLQERLELFVPICMAVQHAHHKGIVHRDLKPANILVTLIDGSPVPKVIDFGVAKAIGGKLTDKTIETLFGSVVGTLEYMSPEQAGFSNDDVDTRADIYSLGVVLYELLTGLRPIDIERFRKASLTEMVRIIKEDSPSKPSTRISTDESLPSLAALRRTEPRKLVALLRGDLDWIVLKCLEKSRERRYGTANQLAQDVNNYLNSDPVVARPPTTSYRFRKFAAKHRSFLISLTSVAALLVTATCVSLWFAFDSREARQQADNKTREVLEEKKLVQVELKNTREMLKVLSNSFDSVSPNSGGNAGMLARDVLMDALANLESSELNERAKATLLTTLCQCFTAIGEYPQAISAGRRAAEIFHEELGPDSINTIHARRAQASALSLAGQIKEALKLRTQVVETLVAKHSTRLGIRLQAMNDLANSYRQTGQIEKAFSLREQVFQEMCEVKDLHDVDTLRAMGNLALSHDEAGRSGDALNLYLRARDLSLEHLPTDHPVAMNARNNLANCYEEMGNLEKAIALHEENLKLLINKLGKTHRRTLATRLNLGNCYFGSGQRAKAIGFAEKTLELMQNELPANHPDMTNALESLAIMYRDSNRVEDAIELAERSRELRARIFGNTHSYTLSTMGLVASCYHKAGNTKKAIEINEEAIGRFQEPGQNTPLALLTLLQNQAQYYVAIDKADLAVKLGERVFNSRNATFGPTHPTTLLSLEHLTWINSMAGNQEHAIELAKQCLGIWQDKYGSLHYLTVKPMIVLGSELSNHRVELERAVELFSTSCQIMKANPQRFSKNRLNAVLNNLEITMGKIYQQTFRDLENCKFDVAEHRLRTVEEFSEPHANATMRTDTNKLLMWALMGQKKWKASLEQILKWRSCIEANEDPSGPRLIAIADASRAVCNFELGEIDEAKKSAMDAIGFEDAIPFSTIEALSVLAICEATEKQDATSKSHAAEAKGLLEKELEDLPEYLSWSSLRTAERLHRATLQRHENGKADDEEVHECDRWLREVSARISASLESTDD